MAAAQGARCLGLHDDIPQRYRRGARPVLVEQRGAHTITLVTSPAGLTCLVRDNGPSRETSGNGSAWVEPRLDLAPNGMLTEGVHIGSDDELSTRDVVGRVGVDVVGVVVVHTAQQGDVTATVKDGAFAAWWPGAPIGMGPLGPDPSFTLTLRDGTIRDLTIRQVDVTPS